MENTKKTKEFSNLTRQNILYRFAKCSQDELGRGFLIQYEITMMLLGKIGKKPLEDVWKEKSEENFKKLRELGSLISNINFFLFNVDDQRFKKEIDTTELKFIKARKVYNLAIEHLDILYEAFYTLLDSTIILKNMDIPREYFEEKIKKPKETTSPIQE